MQVTDLQLKQYLLGNLDEQTDTEIGLEIIADESFEEKLLIAENDLMEDFLDDNLSETEQKLFYENFLICGDREKQLEEINFFKQTSRTHLPLEVKPEPKIEPTATFWEKLKKLFGSHLGIAAPVLAALLIAAFVGFDFISNQNRLTPLETEYAGLNRRDFTNPNGFSDLSNISLISGTYRSSGDGAKLNSGNLSDRVFFRLGLPFDLPDGESVNAELVKDQKTVFRQPEIRVYKNRSGQEIRLFLPKSVLSKGEFQIKISNPKLESSSVIYDFAVE